MYIKMAAHDRSSDGGDYVSMHHRIRKGLRKRLKHLSADLEKPVTDLVNEAIMAHLDKLEADPSDLAKLPPPELLRALRQARAAGAFYETIATIDKRQLVEVSRLLGEAADLRSSGDRLVSRIAVALAEPN